MSSSTTTRSMERKCPIFNDSRPLPKNQLPTYKDVILAIIHLQNERYELTKSNTSVKDIAKELVVQIKQMYDNELIPVITSKSILDKILSYYAKYRNILKPSK